MAALYSACALFSTWIILLMVGWVLGGEVHLLLVLSLLLFPWRRAGGGDGEGPS